MSALNELRERYKILPLWGRLLAMGVIGAMPAAYIYFDEGAILEESVASLEQQVEEARSKFRDASSKHANLPKLEKDLQFTQQQLAKAKRKLPDQYRVEDTLEKVATIANGSGVLIKEFSPEEEVKKQEPYPYVELPINVHVSGTFAKIADFLNGLIHLEGTVFIKGIELKRMRVADARKDSETINGTAPQDPAELQNLSKYKKALMARENLMVQTKVIMAVYRSMGSNEFAAPAGNGDGAAPKEEKAGKKNKKADGGDGNAAIQIPYRGIDRVAMGRDSAF